MYHWDKEQNVSDSLLVSQPWAIVSRLQECQEALSDPQHNGMGFNLLFCSPDSVVLISGMSVFGCNTRSNKT